MASITVEQALQLAAVYEQAGKLADAESICQNVLAAQPGHASARQRLASIAAARMVSTGLRRRRLYYAGYSRGGFGWGVCNASLVRELSRLVELIGHWSTPEEAMGFEQGEVFMPLIDWNFTPCSSARGRRNFAYIFFEEELGANVAAEAAKYEIVFCGSTWCLERMRTRGITNGQVLLQGVDHEIFRAAPPPAHQSLGAFRVFSGGKFEYRKGQDLVIAAFREFLRLHPEATLVCAWNNIWPETIRTMQSSPHLSLLEGTFPDQRALFQALLEENGIPLANVEIVGPLSQADLAAAMVSTDIGLFPNRCEGGTNLMLMEYLACGRPVVASGATGHRDVLTPENALTVPPRLQANGWDEPEIAALAEAMDVLCNDAPRRAKLGLGAAASMERWSWRCAAETILQAIYPA